MSTITLNVPDIGGSSAQVIEVLVKVGDVIDIDSPLFVLEGDKASMDVPSTQAGIVSEVLLKVGDTVSENRPMLILENRSAAEPLSHEVSKSSEPTLRVVDLVLPDLGTDSAVDVIEVLVKIGDVVQADQNIVTLEGDKASMDIPAPYAGIIASLTISVGDKVKTGEVFGKLQVHGESKESNTTMNSINQTHTSHQPSNILEPIAVHSAAVNHQANSLYAGPSVRRIASELDIDLSKIRGTGNKGRITKEDLKAFLSGGSSGGSALPFAIAKAPKVDFAKFGSIESVALNKIKLATAANMARNWITIPHVTQFGDADITDMEAYRQKQKQAALDQGARLTPIVFILKALVKVLKNHPNVNASLSEDGKELIIKNYYHIGVAVDTPEGLVVPVIRDVDQKSIITLAKELAEVSAKAREGKLKLTDMQGGTFTISSLGGIGGTAFTPIVNAPEVAILGVSKSAMAPVYNDQSKTFDARLMLPLSLSYDHRVIDGAQGARFIVELAAALEDVSSLLL